MTYCCIKSLSNTPSYLREIMPAGWRHTSTATVGFDTAEFDMFASRAVLEELFFNGLGRRVIRYCPDGIKIMWDGYIHEMTLVYPGVQAKISIDALNNYITVIYTALNTTTNPPTETPDTTYSTSDTASIAQYGRKDLVYRPPQPKLTTSMAQHLGGVLLNQYVTPRSNQDIASRDEDIRLRVSCRGFMHTLRWRYYNQTTTSGTANADVIVGAIETAVGDFITSTQLSSNTALVNQYFGDYDIAFDLIRTIAACGDAGDNRWVAHVFENRKLIFKQAATTVRYLRRIGDSELAIYDRWMRRVPYWEVRPDAWIRTVDLTPMTLKTSDLTLDKRAQYVESVEWIEQDNQIHISGIPADRVQSLVARLAAEGEFMM